MRNRSGFSLLEVVVAMAILALAIVTIIELFGTGLRAAAVSRDYTTALSLAENKLTTILMSPELEEEDTSGDFEGTDYEWELIVEEYRPNDISEDTIMARMEQTDSIAGSGDTAPTDQPGQQPQPTEPSKDGDVTMYDVRLEVRWPSGNGEKTLELQTLRLEWNRDRDFR